MTNNFLDDVENNETLDLPQEVLNNVEADTYWCLSKFLDGIQVCFVIYIYFRSEPNCSKGLLHICSTRHTKNDIQASRTCWTR